MSTQREMTDEEWVAARDDTVRRFMDLQREASDLRAVADLHHDDAIALLEAVGLSTHARPISPHQVVREEVVPAIAALRAEVERLAEVIDAGSLLMEQGTADILAFRTRAEAAEAREATLREAGDLLLTAIEHMELGNLTGTLMLAVRAFHSLLEHPNPRADALLEAAKTLDELVQACTATLDAEEFGIAVARGRAALAALDTDSTDQDRGEARS